MKRVKKGTSKHKILGKSNASNKQRTINTKTITAVQVRELPGDSWRQNGISIRNSRSRT